ncbi:hypothetical protein B4Q13_19680, partial [Lacticaseibacillus rhamnosus]
ALISPSHDVRWTWKEFAERVDALAAGFLALGLQRGERIGIWSLNRPEWTLTQFAAAKAGLILVTINQIEPIYEKASREQAQRPAATKVGFGVACLGYGIGYSGIRNPSTARIEVGEDGLVTAHCGTPDIGTGSDTALAQIVVENRAGAGVPRFRLAGGGGAFPLPAARPAPGQRRTPLVHHGNPLGIDESVAAAATLDLLVRNAVNGLHPFAHPQVL